MATRWAMASGTRGFHGALPGFLRVLALGAREALGVGPAGGPAMMTFQLQFQAPDSLLQDTKGLVAVVNTISEHNFADWPSSIPATSACRGPNPPAAGGAGPRGEEERPKVVLVLLREHFGPGRTQRANSLGSSRQACSGLGAAGSEPPRCLGRLRGACRTLRRSSKSL